MLPSALLRREKLTEESSECSDLLQSSAFHPYLMLLSVIVSLRVFCLADLNSFRGYPIFVCPLSTCAYKTSAPEIGPYLEKTLFLSSFT